MVPLPARRIINQRRRRRSAPGAHTPAHSDTDVPMDALPDPLGAFEDSSDGSSHSAPSVVIPAIQRSRIPVRNPPTLTTIPPLRPPWEEHYSLQHNVFYFWNPLTGASTWTRPTQHCPIPTIPPALPFPWEEQHTIQDIILLEHPDWRLDMDKANTASAAK